MELTVTDSEGELHNDSTWFETGKMGEPWQGQWIGLDGEPEFAPIFSGEFSAIGAVETARLYMVGLGVYTAALNGQPVSDELLAPGLWYFEEETQYQTYDVTHLIEEDNRLEVALGNGWYKGRFGLDRNPYANQYALLAELHITFADGTTQVFTSNEGWQWKESDITAGNSIYDGETLDRLAHANGENPLRPVAAVNPALRLADRISPPVKEMLSLPVAEIIHTPAGETVLDFGQNHTGLLRFHAALPARTEVHFDFGEVLLQDKPGSKGQALPPFPC